MGKRLKDSISSKYIEAANKLRSKTSRRRIVAYVESYDDVFFWRTVLSKFEDDTRYFEVLLPSNHTLERGKKSAMMRILEDKVGRDMIACVDADYDYLINGATETSQRMINNPYVFHTFAYSIENLQCYAPSLHNVCVAVTLNDHQLIDVEEFMKQYSIAIFPLFVWSIWHYRRPIYTEFTITDFNRIIELGGFNLNQPFAAIANLRHKVGSRIAILQKKNPDAKESYLELKRELIEDYGINPEDIGLEKLINRIKEGNFKEIIIAVKPSIEGETTSLYIKKILEGMNVKVTRIASGIPIGADMEYIDAITLERALTDRKEIN